MDATRDASVTGASVPGISDMGEVYFSIDVETDGPIPGPHSMLSLGCAAFSLGRLVDSFEVNLDPLPGASGHPDTMLWWKSQSEAWGIATRNPLPPEQAMRGFVSWVTQTARGSQPVAIAYPAGFDFMFLYWYLVRFTGGSPFSFSAVDIKTYVMARTGRPYRRCGKRSWPARWRGDEPHTHRAVDDAIEQGRQFLRIRQTV